VQVLDTELIQFQFRYFIYLFIIKSYTKYI